MPISTPIDDPLAIINLRFKQKVTSINVNKSGPIILQPGLDAIIVYFQYVKQTAYNYQSKQQLDMHRLVTTILNDWPQYEQQLFNTYDSYQVCLYPTQIPQYHQMLNNLIRHVHDKLKEIIIIYAESFSIPLSFAASIDGNIKRLANYEYSATHFNPFICELTASITDNWDNHFLD